MFYKLKIIIFYIIAWIKTVIWLNIELFLYFNFEKKFFLENLGSIPRRKKSRIIPGRKKNPGSIPWRKKNPGSIPWRKKNPGRVPGKNPSTGINLTVNSNLDKL